MLAGLPVEHPPLYFALLHAWTRLAGDGDLSLRMPSLLASVAAVPLGAWVAGRLAGGRAGLITGLVLSVQPFLVWYGQEARMYSLLLALGLGTTAAVLRARRGKGQPRWWAAAGALGAAALYTHYFAALLLAALAVWAVAEAVRGSRHAAGWALAGLVAAAAWAPWLPRARAALAFGGWREPEPLPEILARSVALWTAGETASPTEQWAAAGVYGLLAAVGVAAVLRLAPDRRRAIVALVLVPALVLAALLLRRPDFHPRYAMAVLPGWYVLVSAGAAALPGPAAAVAAGALVAAAAPPLAHLYGDPAFQKPDYRWLVGQVESSGGEPGLLLDGPSFGLVERYRAPDSPVRVVDLHARALRDLHGEALDRAVDERLAGRVDLWLASDGAATGDGRRWVASRACPVETRSRRDLQLARYVRSDVAAPAPPRAEDAPAAVSAATPATGMPGELLAVSLAWRPGGSPADALYARPHSVSLRLVDAAGGIAASSDGAPVVRPTTDWRPGVVERDCRGLAIPTSAPPGRYEVVVVLYDPASPRPLLAVTVGSVAVGGAPTPGGGPER